MGLVHCEICLEVVEKVAASSLLVPLLHKHLGVLVCRELVSCEACSQLLHLWDTFSAEARVNLKVSHPIIPLCEAKETREPWVFSEVGTCGAGQQDGEWTNEDAQAVIVFESDSTDKQTQLASQALHTPSDLHIFEEDDFAEPQQGFLECWLDSWSSSPPPSPWSQQDPLLLQSEVKPDVTGCRGDSLVSPPHPCNQCNKSFLYERSLCLHTAFKHPVKREEIQAAAADPADKSKLKALRPMQNILLCPKCNSAFKSKRLLISHLIKTCLEEKNGKITCILCKQLFISTSSLLYHLQNHFNRSFYFKCKFCIKHFTSKQSLNCHVRKHFSNSTTKVTKINLHSKTSQLNLNSQVSGSTILKKEKNTCNFCHKEFLCNSHVKKHIDRYHAGPQSSIHVDSQYQCKQCNSGFLSARSLARHMFLHPENSLKRKSLPRLFSKFKNSCVSKVNLSCKNLCKMCGKIFSSKRSLGQHKRVHSKTQEQKKPCPIKKETQIKIKSKTQNGLSPSKQSKVSNLTCKFCNQTKSNSSYLLFHIHRFHDANYKLEFQCTMCIKSFVTKLGLFNHEQNHAKQSPQCLQSSKAKGKPSGISKGNQLIESQNINSVLHPISTSKMSDNKCEICHTILSSKQNLKFHLQNIHFHPKSQSNESRTFSLKANKIKSKYFTCSYCNKAMASSQILKTHVIRYHSSHSHHDLHYKFVCQICSRRFPTKFSLSLHLRHHSESKSLNYPVKSNEIQSKVQELKTSTKFIPSKQIIAHKTFTCKFCKKNLSRIDHLKTHIRLMHTQNKITCPKCGNISSTKFDHKLHFKQHLVKIKTNQLGKKEKIENKIQPKLSSSHTNQSNIACKFCLKMIKTGYLNRHMKICHLRTNNSQLSFRCKICSNSYQSNKGLTVHMANHRSYPSKSSQASPESPETQSNKEIQQKTAQCKKNGGVVHIKQDSSNYTKRDSLYFCNFCMKSDSTLSYIQQHISKVHLR